MSTPHNAAEPGDIAERILLPGDPLRAKFIAENFLEEVECYNTVRNMLGFTGVYKGERVSVQGTGMGMPSISIYVDELIRVYGVRRLMRVGTCGAMHEDINLGDMIIAQGASTDSGMIRNIFGGSINYAPLADFELLRNAVKAAESLMLPVKVGNVISVDRFYDEEIDNEKLRRYRVLAVDMETAALYTLAAKYDARALAIFTASDHLLRGESASTKDRQTAFVDMMRIALETIVTD